MKMRRIFGILKMWMRQEQHLCKLHNEVFETAESRINTECLPLAGGDESTGRNERVIKLMSAPLMRG